MNNKKTITKPIVKNFILQQLKNRMEILGVEPEPKNNIISNGQSLVDSGLYDSLSFLDLLVAIENEFNLEIDLSEYDPEYFVTPDGLTTIVTKSTIILPKEKNVPVISEESSGLIYEELTPLHPCWSNLPDFFNMLYTYLETFDLKIPLKKNGANLWLKSIEKTLGRTNYVIGTTDSGKLVGYLHGYMKILPIYLEGGYVGIMSSMYVLPEYRKHGVAAQMAKRMIQWFESREVHSIEAQVQVENELVINFWQKNGLEKELVQVRRVVKK